MKEEPQTPWTDPELEARIVALVLGEASDFERDELNRLIGERPELAAFKEQTQGVHGLLRDVATGESVADDDDWKLPAEKRNALLAVIGGAAKEQPANQVVTKSAEKRRSVKGNLFWTLTKIAAVVGVIGFFGSMAIPKFFNIGSPESSRIRMLASKEAHTLDPVDAFESFLGEASAPSGETSVIDGAETNTAKEEYFSKAGAELDHVKNSKNALSAIRGALKTDAILPSLHDLADDVQYLPAVPEVKVPQDSATTLGIRAGEMRSRVLPAGVNGPSKDISAEHESGEVASGKLDAWHKTRELAEVEPSQSTMAGMVVGERRLKSLDHFDVGVSEAKGLITDKLAIPLPSLTTKPESWGDEVKSGGRFTLGKSRKEGVVKESVNVPVEGNIAIHDLNAPDLNAPDHSALYSFQIPEAVAGIAIGQPVSESEAGQSTQDNRWGYYRSDQPVPTTRRNDSYAIEKRVKDSLEKLSDSKKAWGTKPAAPAGLQEKSAQDEAFSTFSLHVGDVSFKLARAALARGEWPEAAKVRVEEFINAFDYGDPMPSQSERVSCRLEQSIHPFLQQRNLLRISMRTAAAGRSSNTPLRLTFLLDNSGSMERLDRQQTVRRAFALLAQQLTLIDQVTLISFARQPRLLADKVSGAQSHQLVQLIADLPSEGGTNIEAALQLAFEKAKEQQVDDGQNRIILLTDGAVNLGDANPENLARIIKTMRLAGIAFDAAGISAEGLNDEVLEALTRKGDGRYYLLDSPEAADDGFARQIAGALRPSAKNVKVQIEFNPQRVGAYKLLGFEKHRLKQEDFRNDKVDASELAAAEAGVAVYQFEAKPDGRGDVGSVSVRFRDVSTGQMIEDRWPIPYEADAPRPDQAAPSMRIATSAALLAAKLRGDPLGETVDLKTLSDLIAGLPDRDRMVDRVQQLQQMIQQARQVSPVKHVTK